MIISTEYKIIYLSNCKCASSCIRQRFMPINNKKLVEEVEKNFNHNPHAPYNKVKKYLLEKHSIDTNKFFLFSTIRNPWERVVSLYKYAKPDKNGVPFWADKFGVERIEGTRCNFEDFVLHGLYFNYNRTAGSFVFACRNVQDMFGEDYSKFKLYNSEDLDIDKIMDDIDNKNVKDKVSTSPLQIVDSNQWHVTKPKRDSEDYKQYYNVDLQKIIANHYKLDIEIGEYKF